MLRVVGAGLPRTATRSLKGALELLLGDRCYHMAEVFEHLEEDVPAWRAAIRGDDVDWSSFPPSCVATVDWPASAFWRELAEANPEAVIVLSTRESAAKWWESCDETILPVLRKPVEQPENEEWQQMALELAAREIGPDWDDAEHAQAFYDRHNAQVRREAPADRLLDWRATDGWEPLCSALGVAVPDEPFPRVNTREEWAARNAQ
jgi:hypothetical protein